MLNQVVIVGRLTERPRIEWTTAYMSLSVPRSYKNEMGEYENDIIPVKITAQGIIDHLDHIQLNDLIGVKGRLINNGNFVEVIADKLTFLSNNG